MTYYPKGVCSRQFDITLRGDLIEDVKIMGGCHGNLQAIRALIIGRPALEVIPLLEGIRCGVRPTSCPDQLAKALTMALKEDFIHFYL